MSIRRDDTERGVLNLRNGAAYIRRFLKIRTKRGEIVPLTLNQPQEKLYAVMRGLAREERPIRIIILKARQMGFSTLTEAIIFHHTATRENIHSLIVAHREDSTANLFAMSKLYYEELPPEIRPMKKASNAQELVFENSTRDPVEKKENPGLRSKIRCATAGGDGIGRSDTLQQVHLSEFAFWPGDKLKTYTGIMQAVPDLVDTMVVVESTANGFDQFKDLWDEAVAAWARGERDGLCPVFFPWWEMEEYRREVPQGFAATPEERELAKTYGLDNRQLAWRRWCIKVNCGGSLDLFRQEYPASADEAFVASGRCIFAQAAIVLRREQVKALDRKRGRFQYKYDGLRILDVKWVPDEQGVITIYQPPGEGRPYVVGGDTAGEGSDFFAGQVIDNVSGQQVAVLHQALGEGEYVRQMFCLGLHYNTALLGIESNFSTFPNAELARLGYPRLYIREATDTYTGALKKSFGFRTDSITRPLILSQLVELTEQNLALICDYGTLGEMLTFVRNEMGRPEAQSGEHDDRVMALAIAYHIRPQQSMSVCLPTGAPAKWTQDMLEDYRAADSATRDYLVEKWGNPF